MSTSTVTTSALSVTRLAALMREQVAAAYDADLRPTGESDATVLGRLLMLSTIGDALWLGDLMTAHEEAALHSATGELNKACDHLQSILAEATSQAVDPKPHLAALQCERQARYHEKTGKELGQSKAAGYRHAVHIFRVMGALTCPPIPELRALALPQGELWEEAAIT